MFDLVSGNCDLCSTWCQVTVICVRPGVCKVTVNRWHVLRYPLCGWRDVQIEELTNYCTPCGDAFLSALLHEEVCLSVTGSRTRRWQSSGKSWARRTARCPTNSRCTSVAPRPASAWSMNTTSTGASLSRFSLSLIQLHFTFRSLILMSYLSSVPTLEALLLCRSSWHPHLRPPPRLIPHRGPAARCAQE